MEQTADTVNVKELLQQVEELKKQNEYFQTEAKNAFEKRQQTRAELEAIKLEKEESIKKELEAQNKYKELYENTAKELETYKPYADKVKDYETKFATIQEQRKAEILNKLPENMRNAFAKIQDVELLNEQVNTIIESMPTKIGVDSSKASKGNIDYSSVNVKTLSVSQLEDLKQKNPKQYEEVLKRLLK